VECIFIKERLLVYGALSHSEIEYIPVLIANCFEEGLPSRAELVLQSHLVQLSSKSRKFSL